ncbi:LacI family DNA-binding transcriptional regulator [Vibrio sp. MA40-2]|uniref:LacI family DNA-binding transcriptional regulator n=1 Tax=Vibrio sp. MA40-2 TaxID=3391828 RepID=UPI0039A6F9C1
MRDKASIPTLDDVAKLANVSKAVASRALSGKNRPIAAEKKIRVLKAAEELGYVANPFAQSLRDKSTGLVAIVVNHIADISDLALFDPLIQAIQALEKQALFIRLRSEEDITEIKRNPFVHRVDAALIFSDLIQPEEAPTLFYTDKVIMLNGRKIESGFSVTVNEALGIEEAILNANQRSISQALLLCGRQTSSTEQERIKSYQQAMKTHHIDIVELAYCDYSYELATQYLESQPQQDRDNLGIFCTSDAMAMAAVDFFRNNSPDIVNKKFIYGFDNTQFSQRGSYRFSSIGYCNDSFIKKITSLLRKNTFKNKQSRHLTVDTTFYCRD